MPPTTTALVDVGGLGLRDRKKLGTRDALVRAAFDLFESKGVEATTVDEIAAAVDVSARTFHRYFGAKEDVLVADQGETRERFATALADRPEDEPLLDSLRIAVGEVADRFTTDPEHERRRLTIMRRHPNVAARLRQTDQWSTVVVEHAASRLAMSARDPLPLLLGACTVAALRAAVERWLEHPGSDYQAELDHCFELLGDLRTATTPRRRRTPR